jgi:hypothetical protein
MCTTSAVSPRNPSRPAGSHDSDNQSANWTHPFISNLPGTEAKRKVSSVTGFPLQSLKYFKERGGRAFCIERCPERINNTTFMP